MAELEGLGALWLFGSFARGEATPVSNVDLRYLPTVPSEDLDRRLYRVVTETLGTDEVTLVDVRTLPVTVAWQVAAEGRPLVVRDVEAVSVWLEHLFRAAADARWLRAQANADFLRGVLIGRGEVDRERVVALLRMVAHDLEDLRAKAQVNREHFLGSPDLQAVVECRLQTAAEGCLNVGNHIVTRRRLEVPRDYAEVFRIVHLFHHGNAYELLWDRLAPLLEGLEETLEELRRQLDRFLERWVGHDPSRPQRSGRPAGPAGGPGCGRVEEVGGFWRRAKR